MAKTTAQVFGGINVVVANASALWWKSIEETPLKRYDLINTINARGAFACAHHCLPHMREAGWGHFVTQSPPIMTEKLRGMTACECEEGALCVGETYEENPNRSHHVFVCFFHSLLYLPLSIPDTLVRMLCILSLYGTQICTPSLA